MPDPTPIEFTRMWHERLRRSYRSKRQLVRRWRILTEFYEGNYFAEASQDHRVAINLVFSIVRQKMSTLYFQNPKMWFKGMSEVGAQVAPIMADFHTLVRRINDSEHEERIMLFDALHYGTGVLKHGYNAEFGIETPLTDDSILKRLQKQGKLPELNVSVDDLELSKGIFAEHDLRVRGGYPWVKAIPPPDYLVDSEAMDFSECRWKGHHFWRPYADVIRDGRYDEEAREEIQPTGRSSFALEDDRAHPRDDRQNSEDRQDDSSMVSLYEICDLENGEIIVITDTDSRPLMRVPDPLNLVDGPYEELVFYESKKGPWGLSDTQQYAPLVESLNKISTDSLDHLSRFGRSRGIYRNAIMSADEAANIVQCENGVLQGVDFDNEQSLSSAIEMLPQETISPDAWRVGDQLRSFIDEISGVNENARGGSSGTETATEANIINQQGGLRANDQSYQLMRALRRSTRRQVQILKKFWPTERVVPIVGQDGRVWELATLTQDHVMSAYEIDIEPGSTESFANPVKARQILDLMREMVNFAPWLQQQGAQVNFVEMMKAVLRALDVTKNPERFLILPQPAPQAAALPGFGPGQPGGQGAGNILPFIPGQQPGPAPVGAQGEFPTESQGFESGRALSEAGAI